MNAGTCSAASGAPYGQSRRRRPGGTFGDEVIAAVHETGGKSRVAEPAVEVKGGGQGRGSGVVCGFGRVRELVTIIESPA